MSSFLRAIFSSLLFSLLKRRSAMDKNTKNANMILDSTSAFKTTPFVVLFRSWAAEFLNSESDDTDITKFLQQIEVSVIMHQKMPHGPEHEFLLLETKHRFKGASKCILLERSVSDGEEPQPRSSVETTPSLIESIKQIASSLTVSPSDLGSMEEGHSSLSQLPFTDKLTLISTEIADAASESIDKDKLDKFKRFTAIDRFAGESFVFSMERQGKCARYFKPKNPISLFEVAILAEVVHDKYPQYSLLRSQCYFYSSAIYQALEHYFGSSESFCFANLKSYEGPGLGKIIINNCYLSGKFGRYKGALVSTVDTDTIAAIVTLYKEEYNKEISDVIFIFFNHCRHH
jgi:hypothetical protein